jgi:thymidylate synthase (FAD)
MLLLLIAPRSLRGVKMAAELEIDPIKREATELVIQPQSVKTVLPKVYWVTNSHLDLGVVDEFLTDNASDLSYPTSNGVDKKPEKHISFVGATNLWVQDDAYAHHAGEDEIELAGRLCYMAFGKNQGNFTNRAYVLNLLEQKHFSVLEHVTLGFIVIGISRSLSHELVRHRIASYSQLSQRYVDESEVRFVMPLDIMGGAARARSVWYQQMALALEAYKELTDELSKDLRAKDPNISKRNLRIAARQAARSVLPNSTETKIFITMNLRELRHFCLIRGSLFAEPEIRRLAIIITRDLKKMFPNAMDDFEILTVENSDREITRCGHPE